MVAYWLWFTCYIVNGSPQLCNWGSSLAGGLTNTTTSSATLLKCHMHNWGIPLIYWYIPYWLVLLDIGWSEGTNINKFKVVNYWVCQISFGCETNMFLLLFKYWLSAACTMSSIIPWVMESIGYFSGIQHFMHLIYPIYDPDLLHFRRECVTVDFVTRSVLSHW